MANFLLCTHPYFKVCHCRSCGGSKFAFSHWQGSSLIQQLVATAQAVMSVQFIKNTGEPSHPIQTYHTVSYVNNGRQNDLSITNSSAGCVLSWTRGTVIFAACMHLEGMAVLICVVLRKNAVPNHSVHSTHCCERSEMKNLVLWTFSLFSCSVVIVVGALWETIEHLSS